MYRSLSVLSVALAVFLLASCSGDDMSKNSRSTQVDSASHPDSEVRGARILLYDRGRVTTEVLAGRIHKFEANDSTMGYEINIIFLDSSGEATSTVVGDSGIIRESDGDLFIYGNVVVVTEDSTRLDTDYLHYNQDVRKIRTDAFVKITDLDQNVVTGWGMEADRNLGRYKILKHVSGSVKQAPEAGAP